MRLGEAKLKKESAQNRNLTKTIDSTTKAANMSRLRGINDARGLNHIHLVLQRTLEKGLNNIQLSNKPFMRESYG
ncbi:unnamed protein product [Linum trigynum]|uniref:Uncharacterized protein n=1 Tax=Linum trigynum TaxID=586398 RepID=A0AAV2DZ73_9ROSI